MATSTQTGEPFSYIKDNAYVGYDLDMAARFCQAYGYALEIVDTNFSGVFANIASNKADFGAASICVTEERKEEMKFSGANYDGSIVLVALKEDAVVSGTSQESGQSEGLFASLSPSFEKTFVRENRWKMFASGLGITVLITVLCNSPKQDSIHDLYQARW